MEFLTKVTADIGIHSVEVFDHTDKFIEKFQEEIENELPNRFADVYVDAKTVTEIVYEITKDSKSRLWHS